MKFSEFKFKVWDKTKKEMFGPYSLEDIKAYDGECHSIWLQKEKFGEIVDIGDDLGYGHNRAKEIQEKLELLRFTGVKDKNDKEIYEGDILKFQDFAEIISHVKWDSFGDGSMMEYFENIDCWMCNKLPISTWKTGGVLFNRGDGCDENGLEIIGNIYENPELNESRNN